MKKSISTGCALVLAVAAFASEPVRMTLFPAGTPSRTGLETTSEGLNAKGDFVRVSDPELLAFFPAPEAATGQAMLVVPGGGYGRICIAKATAVAEWLVGHGIAAFILKYRMPNGHPDAVLEDGEQAMRMIRDSAARWGIDPRNVGVIGTSAGGHLAAVLATRYTSEATRPDFVVLLYPALSMEYPNGRTRENLLGAGCDDETLRSRWSMSGQVHAGMPEVLLVLCDDDEVVPPENSIGFYAALKRHGVKAELHVFPRGGHGFWMQKRYEYGEETYPIIMRWIRQHKTINEQSQR